MFPNSEMTGLEWLLPLMIIRAGLVSDVTLGGPGLPPRRHLDGPRPGDRRALDHHQRRGARLGLHLGARRPDLRLCPVDGRRARRLAWLRSSSATGCRGAGGRTRPLCGSWPAATFRVAAADAIEWGSRRLDIALPRPVLLAGGGGHLLCGAARRLACPPKLKTSFDPILGPVVTRNLNEGDHQAVAKQVRQVGFWVISNT